MAIKMISNYSKRLGLPGYSSHQFSVSLETELMTTDEVAAESERLYHLLQTNVDEQILTTGFVPPYDYGMDAPQETSGANHAPNASTSGAANLPANPSTNGSANKHTSTTGNSANWQRGPAWKCSEKQRDLILKLVEEHQLNKHSVEALAVERFGKGVCLLNKIEASGLIEELLDTHGGNDQGQGNARRRNGSAYNGATGRSAA